MDHYDSFTFNLIDWLVSGEPGLDVHYVAADDVQGMAALAGLGLPLVLSPGPKAPDDAPATLALIHRVLGQVPILGICLGHQMLARVAGAAIVPARAPFHGSTRTIRVRERRGPLAPIVAAQFRAASYNSLVVEASSLPAPWRVTALCEDDEIQGIAWEPAGLAPAFGLQFHPESFLSEAKAPLRRGWLAVLERWYDGSAAASDLGGASPR